MVSLISGFSRCQFSLEEKPRYYISNLVCLLVENRVLCNDDRPSGLTTGHFFRSVGRRIFSLKNNKRKSEFFFWGHYFPYSVSLGIFLVIVHFLKEKCGFFKSQHRPRFSDAPFPLQHYINRCRCNQADPLLAILICCWQAKKERRKS